MFCINFHYFETGKNSIEWKTFEPEGAHCIKKASKSCRELQISSDRSSNIPGAAEALILIE